jgi:hypothetical protein
VEFWEVHKSHLKNHKTKIILKRCTGHTWRTIKQKLFWRGAQALPEELWNKKNILKRCVNRSCRTVELDYSEEVHKPLLKNYGIKTILKRCTWSTVEFWEVHKSHLNNYKTKTILKRCTSPSWSTVGLELFLI